MRNDTGRQFKKFDTNQITNPKMADKMTACKAMAVSQVFIFHFNCYSLLHFAVYQLLCWAFLFPVCGGVLTSPTGTIKSPNYPNLYTHLRQCTWLIRVAEGRRVTLTFSDIETENYGGYCQLDYIQVGHRVFFGVNQN